MNDNFTDSLDLFVGGFRDKLLGSERYPTYVPTNVTVRDTHLSSPKPTPITITESTPLVPMACTLGDLKVTLADIISCGFEPDYSFSDPNGEWIVPRVSGDGFTTCSYYLTIGTMIIFGVTYDYGISVNCNGGTYGIFVGLPSELYGIFINAPGDVPGTVLPNTVACASADGVIGHDGTAKIELI